MAAITSQWWRRLVNAYVVKSGMVCLQWKTQFARGNVPLCIIARKRFARKRSARCRIPTFYSSGHLRCCANETRHGRTDFSVDFVTHAVAVLERG